MLFVFQLIMQLGAQNKSMILNLLIQLRKIFSPGGSVIVNTLKPKWAWTGVKKQDGFSGAFGELMKDGLSVIVST